MKLPKPAFVAALAFAAAAGNAIADPATTYFNANYQDLPLAPYPGITVASLKLPPGQYVLHVKFRYRPQVGTGDSQASCAFQGVGIIALDASQALVPLVGVPGSIDGVMMAPVTKNFGDDQYVHVQCFGDPAVHIFNTQFAAVLSTITYQ